MKILYSEINLLYKNFVFTLKRTETTCKHKNLALKTNTLTLKICIQKSLLTHTHTNFIQKMKEQFIENLLLTLQIFRSLVSYVSYKIKKFLTEKVKKKNKTPILTFDKSKILINMHKLHYLLL